MTTETAATVQASLFAHYFAGRGEKHVTITTGPSLRDGFVAWERVNGKREARTVAASYNAKPWNF